MVKVFMPCRPTVYPLVIWESEKKHILCLLLHLLSGCIHSFICSSIQQVVTHEVRGKQGHTAHQEGELSVFVDVCVCVCVCSLTHVHDNRKKAFPKSSRAKHDGGVG